jgi:Ca2+-binding RTX toxin-like protein
MAVGFATLSGGDTISFALDPSQLVAVQNALFNLSAHDGLSEVSSVFGSTWQHPTEYNIYNLDGGTTVPFLPAHTDAIVLDSVNGSTGTSLSGNSQHSALWVGNQGNDTFTITGPDQTIIAGDGNNIIDFAGDGEVSVGGGSNTISFAGSGSVFAGDGNNWIMTDTSERPLADGGHDGHGHDDHDGHGNNHGRDGHDEGYGAGATTIIAGSGNNSLTLGSATTWGEYDVTLGGGNDTVTLGLGRATISNSGGSTQLDARHSTGLSYTGAGADTIFLGAGFDSVVETGAATVIGGSRVAGSPPPHATVQGGSGNFVFIGRDGDDSVTAGTGAATLIAGNDNDTFHAGASTNALLDARGTYEDDALYGGSGNATLLGGSGRDSFFGGSGNTTMVGGSNWNFFTGGSGNDTMVAHTVPTGHGDGEHGHGVDQNVFTFDAAVGGHHEIDGYNSTAPGGDTAIHLTFTNYGLTPNQIVADSSIVGNDTVITLPGAGGNPTTTITIKDFTGIVNWNINSH